MQKNVLNVSNNFRRMAIKSTLSILFFVCSYLVMIVFGLAWVLLCALIAYALGIYVGGFITAFLGLGLMGMGLFIFFFLIKFIFSPAIKIDRSQFLEINKEQQPALFKLIHETVGEVKTNFPKKVYLTADINASVFYDATFWSMFFPVKKNLMIGIGLMNSVSTLELKAILAHEFGHFSQRSMKLGSYVFNVNKVIYNLLHENDSYASWLNGWSSLSSFFLLFSKGAVVIIQGIQNILMKTYKPLNLNYRGLSREMEFHADAVAASVTGSVPLISALLRIEFADQALATLLDFYSNKIPSSKKTNNIYPQHLFLIQHLAKNTEMPLIDGLPYLSLEDYKKFQGTKLVLEDQWSSHPSTLQRIEKLAALNQATTGDASGISVQLLSNLEQIQQFLSAQYFEGLNYETVPKNLEIEDFTVLYLARDQEHSFPKLYKGYFNMRDPYNLFEEEVFDHPISQEAADLEQIINDEIIAEINSLNIANADKNILTEIANGYLDIKTFDYDGTKYNSETADILIQSLDEEIARLEELLANRDRKVFHFFLNEAKSLDNLAEFKAHYLNYKKGTVNMLVQREVYLQLLQSSYFIQAPTAYDQIGQNLSVLKSLELPFKEQIKLLLADAVYLELMESKVRSRFNDYLNSNASYFQYDHYNYPEINLLYDVMADYSVLVFNTHFKLKKSLLEFQADIRCSVNQDL
ncbi:M48 family metalloprotease [Pedobacter sp. PACM 27299]|uniref:M48 family metalloprotease n=1 Tax=Pedobacter sp. PACM 27299 TaxID=1727164 RepID=UPI0009EC120A|nr:M48 family metallopeptidase [Pedobacter sp. PACM 27299]